MTLFLLRMLSAPKVPHFLRSANISLSHPRPLHGGRWFGSKDLSLRSREVWNSQRLPTTTLSGRMPRVAVWFEELCALKRSPVLHQGDEMVVLGFATMASTLEPQVSSNDVFLTFSH